MALLEETCFAIVAVDAASARAAQARLDAKTKPRRSLGRLEDLAVRLASIYRTPTPPLPIKAIAVLAGDHGVAEEGVSAYPQEVTTQMLRNFAAGGAAINVLARQAGARVVVVDMGTKNNTDLPGVWMRRVAAGTANFSRGPAMSHADARRALETGIELAAQLSAEGVQLIGLGEMGIANTTAASAITAVLTGTSVAGVTGRGTGVDDRRHLHKIAVIEKALAVNRPDPHDPLDVLAKLGGFEIVGLAGVALGAAARRIPVVLDGFITGAAALSAVRFCPRLRDYLIAAHRSVEPGHDAILRELELTPLLDLELRLGEGTGAALVMPLIDASLHILHEMATFTSAGVTDSGK